MRGCCQQLPLHMTGMAHTSSPPSAAGACSSEERQRGMGASPHAGAKGAAGARGRDHPRGGGPGPETSTGGGPETGTGGRTGNETRGGTAESGGRSVTGTGCGGGGTGGAVGGRTRGAGAGRGAVGEMTGRGARGDDGSAQPRHPASPRTLPSSPISMWSILLPWLVARGTSVEADTTICMAGNQRDPCHEPLPRGPEDRTPVAGPSCPPMTQVLHAQWKAMRLHMTRVGCTATVKQWESDSSAQTVVHKTARHGGTAGRPVDTDVMHGTPKPPNEKSGSGTAIAALE